MLNKNGVIKIIDFGLSDIGHSQSGRCGTLSYMAPELFNSKQYTKSVDIYSVGIITYNIITLGRHPFSR